MTARHEPHVYYNVIGTETKNANLVRSRRFAFQPASSLLCVWVATSSSESTKYLQAEQIVRMVSSDFTSLHHEVLELFVNFSWRVLPRK